MADESDGEFDESILNQPWDPVSYFDEEELCNPDKEDDATTNTTPGKNLTDLFETNLNSLENDLHRISIRRQSQQSYVPDNQNIGKLLQNGDAEVENLGTIDRFISYQDQEDHLKAVDNTLIINTKNIEDDLKRFAHFKQHSIEQDDVQAQIIDSSPQNSVFNNSEFSSESPTNVDDIINLMPDVIKDIPGEPEGLEPIDNEAKEVDIEAILPDAYSGNPSNDTSMISDDANIDYTSAANFTGSLVPQATFSECFDVPVTSGSSSDSINEVITAAEAIIRDYETSRDSVSTSQCDTTDEFSNGIMPIADFDVKTNNIVDGSTQQADLMKDLDSHPSVKYRLVSGTRLENNPTTAGYENINDPGLLIDVNGSGRQLIEVGNKSLHDELASVAIGNSFNDQNLENSVSQLNDKPSTQLAEASVSYQNLPLPNQSKTGKKPHKKHENSSRQKYVVDIIKTDDVESGSSSEESSPPSNSLPITKHHHDELKEKTSQDLSENLNVNGAESNNTLAASLSEDASRLVLIDAQSSTVPSANRVSSSTEDSTSENANQEQQADCNVIPHALTASTDQQNLPRTETVVGYDDIDHITSEITQQLVDEILGENLPNLEDSQAADADNVFTEPKPFTEISAGASSNGPSETGPSEPGPSTEPLPDPQSDLITGSFTVDEGESQNQPDAPPRDHRRTGSTSENEELEEFIAQQLNTTPLPHAPSSPSIPRGISPQVVEDMRLGWYAPKWIPDKETKGCMNCGLKFTVVKRRHHCRACGKVMCSNCCNMKAELPYLEYKPGRVCQACYAVLSEAGSLLLPLPLMSGNQDVPSRGHTISLNDNEPGTPIINDSPPQYMPESPPEYSLTPGAPVQSGPPNPPSYFASSSSSSSSSSSRVPRNRTESDRSVVIMFNSAQTDLPPVLRIENEVVKIINNPNLKGLYQQMKDPDVDPVAFLVNKNLVVKLKIISFDCCIGKQCWCFSSDGMGASNQEEIIFIVEHKGDDHRLLKCVFQQLNAIFERAKHGDPVSDLGFISFDDYMLHDPKNVGMLLFKQTVQCVKNIFVPCHPHLFGIWVQQTESPWAKNLPLRLLLRLGAEFKHYPCPIYNLQKRDPVFNVLGRTIVDLLADFRNFQYTLPRISGLLISVSKKETLIKLPQSRYDEVLKILNVAEENVLALCGNFNRKADSHLVCMESDGTYSTQTITCRSNKKVTGCSFVVFSAALKQSPENIQARSSVVEDGVMVQVTAETMKKIRTAIKDMQDLVVAPDLEAEVASIATSKLKLVWGSSDDPSSRITSPIDGSAFDGLTNMRIRHSYDFTVSTSPAKIHWQEVYFLPNDADTVGRLSAKDLSQMTSSVAKACMNALSPHLSTLVALQMTKIGLRISLDSDSVEYRIGSNKEQLPQELTGELDDKLIPVIHTVMKTVTHRRVSAELIFQIARIV